MDEEFRKAVEFHGHSCPGLAIGCRVSKHVLARYPRSKDEELVAIVENNSCSVDAIQSVLGCTFGKGNLIFKDHGKQVFTFFARGKDKALRVYFKDDVTKEMGRLREKQMHGQLSHKEEEEFERLREAAIEKILHGKEEDLLSSGYVDIHLPQKAGIYPTIRCQSCGEGFMEIRGRTAGGKILCMECFEKLVR